MSGTVEKPQHMQALELANEIRLAQADALRQVRRGESIASVLYSDDQRLGSIAIGRLLCAQHRVGHTRAKRLLNELVINERRPIRKLTERQKREIVAANKADEYPSRRARSGGRERASLPYTVVPTHKNGAAPPQRPAPGHEGISSVSVDDLTEGHG